jgi:hypothetical protein
MLFSGEELSRLLGRFPKLDAEILRLGLNPLYIKSATSELVIFAILDAIEQLPGELRENVEARIRGEGNFADMPTAIYTNALAKLNAGWVPSAGQSFKPYDGRNILEGFCLIRYIINEGIDAFANQIIDEVKDSIAICKKAKEREEEYLRKQASASAKIDQV